MARKPKGFYISTREEMLTSTNFYFEGGKIDYTRDRIDPLDSLFMDAKRDSIINGKKLDENVVTDLVEFKKMVDRDWYCRR